MTHDLRPRTDPLALAASLRLWAIEFVVWLAEMLGEGSLCRSMKRWAHDMLERAEQGASGLVVLAALRLLPEPVDLSTDKCSHPASAPRGFARVAVRGNDMRRMTRYLFPRQRDLLARARRLSAFLDTLATHAQRLARRIARVRPFTRIAMTAPPADLCAAQRITCVMVDDSS